MAEYIKWFVGPQFNKRDFIKILRYRMNVSAAEVEDGIILDKEAFNLMPSALMPHWAFINKEDINSNLHTRPASLDEFKAALDKDTTEQLYIIHDGYYNEYDRVIAKEWDKLKAEDPDRYIFVGREIEA